MMGPTHGFRPPCMCLDSHWDDATADGPVCWGTSPTGSKVSVTRCDGAMATQCGPSTSGATTVSATADERGRWETMLPAGEAARVSDGECSWPSSHIARVHVCTIVCLSVASGIALVCICPMVSWWPAAQHLFVCPMVLVSSILSQFESFESKSVNVHGQHAEHVLAWSVLSASLAPPPAP